MNIYIITFKLKDQGNNYRLGRVVLANNYKEAIKLVALSDKDLDKRTLKCELAATTDCGIKADFEYSDWTITGSSDEVGE